ncbi:hypothetical protein DM558_09800 [Entomomonas moraniae]|uniref:T6SS Phospholipase effector Tle1-like catalytic domain-containing protein n=1 Tax=Entomomonas moraniae TaxID=2213226 RepID=A0A3S9XF28_9GAMM|nr:DUF2235 domain-containing protein [Entomomonas moraniae]AZS51047.1 hypothetical protein DM558_09800 [Entomomonas moraniae]
MSNTADGAFGDARKGQRKNENDEQTGPNPTSQVQLNLNYLRLNVFFDGTGNNMFNTEHRLEDDKKIAEEYDAVDRNLDPDDWNDRIKIKETKDEIHRKRGDYYNLNGSLSYDNDYSNPAILYMAAEVTEKRKRVYIEGSGTIREEMEDQGGLAASTGVSGIVDRVFQAYMFCATELKETKTDGLIFNVFGFSRGAFYGRYFTALLKEDSRDDPEATAKEAQQKEQYAKDKAARDQAALEKRKQQHAKQDNAPTPTWDGPSWYEAPLRWAKNTVQYAVVEPVMLLWKLAHNIVPGTESIPIYTGTYKYQNTGRTLLLYPPEKIVINLVGIYDTVAAHGWNHHNDSVPFKLGIGARQGIKKVIHITAENEYRNHFALVSINTALIGSNKDGHPVGFQCRMPGAHADIGGGYIKNFEEKGKYLSVYEPPGEASSWEKQSGEIDWRWFYKKGFYATEQTKPDYDQLRKSQRQIEHLDNQIAAKKKQGLDTIADEKERESLVRQLDDSRAQVSMDQQTYHEYKTQQLNQQIADKQLAGLDTKAEQAKLKALQESNESKEPSKGISVIPAKEGDYGDLGVRKHTSLALHTYYKVRGWRIFNENAYQYVPLKLMYTLATDDYLKALEFINPNGEALLIESFNKIEANPVLKKYSDQAISLAQANFKTSNKEFFYLPFKDMLTAKESQYLYHDFIHNSLSPEFGFDRIPDYMTNGSQDYNKDKDYNPIRVMVYDDRDGPENTKKNNPYTQGQQKSYDEINVEPLTVDENTLDAEIYPELLKKAVKEPLKS